MTALLLVCGSQRSISLNARLLDTLEQALPAAVRSDRLRPEHVDLPLFCADDENKPDLRTALGLLHARFCAADAFIVTCPEYNGLMTPWLKNLIDWISRVPHIDPLARNAFLDKPVLLASASPGWSGGAMAIPSLRTLFGYLGALPFGETICVPYAEQAWAEDGRLNPDFAGAHWADCLARFCKLALHTSVIPA